MKKMNKKGFTLIELLAIIVILAIIAVITVPLILGIIDEAREKAAKSSVTGYGAAVMFSYSRAEVDAETYTRTNCTGASAGTCISITNGEVTKNYVIEYSGDPVSCTSGTITEGKLKMTDCKVGNKETPTYFYDNGRACLTSESSNSTACPAGQSSGS